MQEIANVHRDALIDGVERGVFAGWDNFPSALRHALAPATVPLPRRAVELRALPAPLTFASLWPQLRLLATWTGGSCGIALARLRADLPPDCTVFDIGYVSTEFRGTLTLRSAYAAGLPLLDQHFYEFVEQSAWDAGRPVFLGLHELAERSLYYVVVTTGSGLYRYFMNDLIAVEGRLAATPLLRFVQKGRGVTSITGEKLYEAQVIDAMGELEAMHHATFYLLLADEAASHYRLHLEPRGAVDTLVLAEALAAALAQRNLEYREKRASGRLLPPEAILLRRGAVTPTSSAPWRAASVKASTSTWCCSTGANARSTSPPGNWHEQSRDAAAPHAPHPVP